MANQTPIAAAVGSIGAEQVGTVRTASLSPTVGTVRTASLSPTVGTVRTASLSPTVELFDRYPDAACVTVNDAVIITGRSRTTIYRDHKAGLLPFVKYAKSTRIQAGDLRRYMNGGA